MPPSLTTVGSVLRGIVSGKSVQTLERPAQDNELGILKVSAVTWGSFRPNENKALPPSYDPKDCPRPMDGDILISRANTRELVGAPVMVHGDYPNLLLSDKLLKLIPDETAVDARYLVRALRSPSASAHFFQCAGGSSGSMTNITQSDIRSAPIYLPPLEEQRRTAAILDQAETLRTQRRTALALLDSLTQSLFLEMFGDPVANPKGFKTCLLGDIIEFVGGSQPAKEHFSFEPSQDSVRLVQIRDFRSDEFKTYIPRKLAKRFFEVDDVMIGRYGPPVFQIFRGLSGSYNVALMKALPKAGVLRDFMFFLLQEPGLHGYVVDRSTRTAGQSGVNLELLENYPAFLPPLPLQPTFAPRIASIEALKATHRRALAALDALFASLQQRAFAGQF